MTWNLSSILAAVAMAFSGLTLIGQFLLKDHDVERDVKQARIDIDKMNQKHSRDISSINGIVGGLQVDMRELQTIVKLRGNRK